MVVARFLIGKSGFHIVEIDAADGGERPLFDGALGHQE